MRIEILKNNGKYLKGIIYNVSVFIGKNMIYLGLAKKVYR